MRFAYLCWFVLTLYSKRPKDALNNMNTDWSYNYQTGPLPHRLWQFTKASMQSMILRPKKGPSASYMSKTDMARYFYILYHLIFVTKWPFKCIFTWAKLRKSMDHNWASLSNWIISGKHLQVREAREHGQLRPLSSNLTLDVISEVIWRPLEPRGPWKWLSEAICIWIPG